MIGVSRWSAAIFFGVVLHAGAVSLAFMQPAPEEAEGGGPIMIELAPMPVAPPAEEILAPPGQLAEATPEMVESPETVAKPVEKTEEAPVVPKAVEEPVDPDLKMAAAEPEEKKKEVEEKPEEPEKVVDEVDRPPAEASAPVPETTAPPPMEGERGEKAAAPAPGLSEKDKKVIASWQKQVVVHLHGHKRYPPQARRKRIEGEVVVKFKIDRSGRVVASSLVSGSGAEILDDAAIDILERASPLPEPPSQLSGNEFELTLPIRYQVM